MNKRFYKVLTAVAAVAAVAVSSAWAGSGGFGAAGAAEAVSPSLEEMLGYAIQDEYLARAEYELIMQEYGEMRPFSNIMAAEERHIEWVRELFEAYGFDVPPDTAKDHVVLPEDLAGAFATGVQAEIDNIAMYASFLDGDLPDDVREVFERLKNASESHLEAFKRNLARYE